MIEWAGTTFTLAKVVYGYFKDGKEVYEDIKDAYDALKGVKEHFEIKESEAKLVDMAWLDKSGFGDQLKAGGYSVAWCRPDKIASRELDGYAVMYEVDKVSKSKRRLVMYDGLTLIGKRQAEAE